ncbi:hypothetical protein RchiOBHm_Chr1g0339251 [Rosa chinensis]|uniref:Uncharacterized protein n=1 Tax=Rosa chinensis TaxID=74649 RepID=A0A2P6SD73_ROSCH|nr:hypothetical protein RchiOBHm_Chr1g0339251 [Rosa chinensis]
MLISYTSNSFPTVKSKDYVPTVFDNISANLVADAQLTLDCGTLQAEHLTGFVLSVCYNTMQALFLYFIFLLVYLTMFKE